jgi:hypothetical protein
MAREAAEKKMTAECSIRMVSPEAEISLGSIICPIYAPREW